MTRRRAVFLDVDGTLVDADGRIPASAAAAVREARARGHRVFVCTGRSRAELWPDLLDLGFDGVIGASGAFASVGDAVILHRGIPDADLARARAHFAALGTDLMLQSDDAIRAPARVRDRLRAALGAHSVPSEEFARGPFGFVDRILTEGEPGLGEVTKIVYLGCPSPLAELRAAFAGVFDIVPSSVEAFGPGSGEVSAAGVDKAYGLDAVVAHLGLDHADTIAIGDSHNDLALLRRAAVGIAMGNADPDVTAAADEVTARVDEDGVRLAFARHGLLDA